MIRVVHADGVITTLVSSRRAALDDPIGIGFAGNGDLWIADELHGRVVSLDTSGAATTMAASLGHPSYIDRGPNGAFHVAGFAANRIYLVGPDRRKTVVAATGDAGFGGDGGPATAATLNFPTRLAAAADGSLYVSDAENHRIRRIDPDGAITTLAGSGTQGFAGDGGPATAAMLDAPSDLALDGEGNLYVADQGNGRVRRVDTHGVITTVAGTG